ncbi:hypothetical protein PPL_02125 [Heterostelium album PN500]|uniref:Peptidase A1 domain-containing protein n=1 Tax=Heterostelium pallidum (strain ATCC 26659 / Pp 5 / PN500) TaxID=670386 RepID=D3B1F3_HETP5|nr:hypothetical protein PPL_02125 [Heterostelium album PN500]EFA85127.1 hypothetical protein PPL_02125 [Heterostelium album PN500]|eukprot:XP_020437236.1 hypothetical protein PPL_02125 [Heterostelium album PN500]
MIKIQIPTIFNRYRNNTNYFINNNNYNNNDNDNNSSLIINTFSNRKLFDIHPIDTDGVIDNNDERYSTFIGAGYRVGVYTISILVGNPSQSFRVMLDTGSATLNIPSVDCFLYSAVNRPTKCRCSSKAESTYKREYSPNSKVHCRTDNCIYSEQFVDKSFLMSQLVEDTVRIGGYSIDSIFGNVNKILLLAFQYKECPAPDVYTPRSFDGIFGLSTKVIDDTAGEDILTQISLKYNLSNSFSLCFGESGYGGQFKIGGYDPELIVEPMRYIPVAKPYTYNLTISQVHIGQYKLEHTTYNAWIDSGSASIVIPTPLYNNMINTMYEKFPLAGFQDGAFWNTSFPCAFIDEKDIPNYPKFNISFVDTDGEIFHLSVLPQNYLVYNEEEKCYELLLRTVDNNYFIIGDLGLIGYNIHFDKQNQRIGFAKASANCSTFSEKLELDVVLLSKESGLIMAKVRGGSTAYSLRGIDIEFNIRSGKALFYPSGSTVVTNSTDENGIAIATISPNYRGNIVVDVVAKELNLHASNLKTVTLHPAAPSTSTAYISFLILFIIIGLIGAAFVINRIYKRRELQKQKDNLDSYEMLLFGAPQPISGFDEEKIT